MARNPSEQREKGESIMTLIYSVRLDSEEELRKELRHTELCSAIRCAKYCGHGNDDIADLLVNHYEMNCPFAWNYVDQYDVDEKITPFPGRRIVEFRPDRGPVRPAARGPGSGPGSLLELQSKARSLSERIG